MLIGVSKNERLSILAIDRCDVEVKPVEGIIPWDAFEGKSGSGYAQLMALSGVEEALREGLAAPSALVANG